MLSHGKWNSDLTKSEVLSVGHSSRTGLEFLAVLEAWEVSAIADVRSTPWSKRNPQFNRDILKFELESRGISYRFMGRSLGGRPSLASLYSNGVADYEKMAGAPAYKQAIMRVQAAAKNHRLALLCSEHDPIECHRCLLVGRSLDEVGVKMIHILSENFAQSQQEIEGRLLKLTGENQSNFLQPRIDVLSHVYKEWSERVAYSKPKYTPSENDVRDLQWS